jgi:ribosome recycling factor
VLDDVLKDAERRMKKTVEHVREDFASVRTGRASASILNRVSVNYYGTPTPLNQIASIAVPSPHCWWCHLMIRAPCKTWRRPYSSPGWG